MDQGCFIVLRLDGGVFLSVSLYMSMRFPRRLTRLPYFIDGASGRLRFESVPASNVF